MPEEITRQEFLEEMRRRGRVRYRGLPRCPKSEYVWSCMCDFWGGNLRYFTVNGSFGVINILKHDPPKDVKDVVFSTLRWKATDVSNTETKDKKEVFDALDKLSFVTDPICLWLNEFGYKNVTRDHAIYLYCLSLGASAAAEKKYEQLVPKPSKMDATKVTRDLALGVYFYSKGAILSGDKLTKCDYYYYPLQQ